MSSELLLNLATWLPRSRANGPGTRLVVWVQGCPFRCLGCQNPENLEFRLHQVVTVEQLWQVFQAIPELEGVSFSGGEPFAQAVALGELARRVQAVGKTVVCWTGYRIEQLRAGAIPGVEQLLEHVDLLIDGLFIQEEAGEYVLRGSANQQLYFLSGRIKEEDLVDIPRQEWILNQGTLTYTGFPIN
ncbi:MAG: radical SAM protein [Symploca sp. SIO2E6]|nr:radical SAM protein [Symploca sp. SIO2E6]